MKKEIIISLTEADFQPLPPPPREDKFFVTTGPDYPLGLKMRAEIEKLKGLQDFRFRYENADGSIWGDADLGEEEFLTTILKEVTKKVGPNDIGTGFDPVMILAKRGWWIQQKAALENYWQKPTTQQYLAMSAQERKLHNVIEHTEGMMKKLGYPHHLKLLCDVKLLLI